VAAELGAGDYHRRDYRRGSRAGPPAAPRSINSGNYVKITLS